MKLFAPAYYQKFACIADRCQHTCCVGWEIDIDNDTMQKYAACHDNYGKRIQVSIDEVDTPHFRLDVNERCPHLDDRGLCKIILNLGEDYLCEICREHPRFYHDTPYGREVGIGMACEEAARLILSSDDYQSIVAIDEIDGDAEVADFDPLPYRAHIYALLSDASRPYSERLHSLYDTYGISPTIHSDEEWRKTFASLEYLDDSHRAMFSSYTSTLSAPIESAQTLERALAYFIFRHCSDVCDKEDFLAALGFCLLCERLLATLASVYGTENIITVARIVSEELEYSEDNTEAIKWEFYP
ncbi:MAG: flagellin lysine-N-methylase [Clostridia bacterium]|nr:flagellin lysine-N-methylase [Clostridia bacterium]